MKSALTGILALVVSATVASAATYMWDTSPAAGAQGGNGIWSTSHANWTTDGGATNVAWDNTGLHTTNFPNFSNGTLTLGSDVTVGKLNAGNTFSPHYTFNGDAGGLYKITLDPAVKTGAYQVTVDGWRPLTINAPLVLSGYPNQFRNSVVVNGVISGTENLSYNFGTLTLNGNNTFSGGFGLGNGTVAIGHDNALGTGDFGWGSSTKALALGGDRTIPNNVPPGNWNYTRIVAGSNNLTVNGSYEVRSAFGTSAFAAFDVEQVDCVVTLGGNFTTRTSGSNGGFKKVGVGTLVLDGTFTKVGGAMAFTVVDGTLEIDSVVDLASVVVNSDGTLSGNGSIAVASSVSVDGTLLPGREGVAATPVLNSLDLGGNLVMQSSALLVSQIAPGSPGVTKAAVTGTATVAGTVDVEYILGYTPTAGDTFVLLSAASVVDNGLTLNAADDLDWDLIVTATEVRLTTAAPPACDALEAIFAEAVCDLFPIPASVPTSPLALLTAATTIAEGLTSDPSCVQQLLDLLGL